MDEENEEQEDLTPQEGEQTPQTQTSENSSAIKERGKSTKKEIGKRLAQSIKNGAGKHSLIAALGPILLWGFVILVIIIIVIGIAMFLVTMPGMVMEKLKAIFKEAGDYVAAFFGADTTEQIEDVEMFETLDYIEQMGYDLKGEGFLTDYMSSADVDSKRTKDNLEDGESAKYDEKVGVIRSDSDKIVNAYSDFIFQYIASDNYVYTIKNNNLATHGKNSSFFEDFFGRIASVGYKIENFFYGPLFDVFGVNDAAVDTWGNGLIAISYEDGAIGKKGHYVNSGSAWNWDGIKIDTDNKTLSIAKNGLFMAIKGILQGDGAFNNPMEFSLDGWTGRYGMPLEFLLAIHKATLMPDLAYDMTKNFDTQVNLLLHNVEGSAIANYKTSSGYIPFDELNTAFTGLDGSGFFGSIISWFDNLQTTDKEAQLAFKMGIEHAPDCECEYGTIKCYTYEGENLTLAEDGTYKCRKKDENGNYVLNESGEYELINASEGISNFDASKVVETEQEGEITKVCAKCKKYITQLVSYLQSNTTFNYEAYSPYIANVENHWYRDVYFVLNEENKEFVDYDYDYEIMTGERWTLYETDKNGDFVYYKLNDDGSTGEKYEGKVIEGEVEIVKGETSESLRIASIGEDGTKVVKKAQTINSSDTEKLTDLGWNNNTDNIWTAYKEEEGTSSTMDPLYPDAEYSGGDDYEGLIKQNCYINLSLNGNIVQTGEGQRTETNSDIKKMFLLNNYFRYDGTDSTAEIITALREVIYGDSKDRYGPVNDYLDNSYQLNFDNEKYTAEHENGTYKVSDYAGNVSLNQDSLNAFTMLENTHTLDADYIYRDFKELIVELGYFKKEELTDETPKLLEWIVPDIGSGGYPDRTIDKRENEYGTMVHSKSDIDVNQKHTLIAVYQKAAEDAANGVVDENIDSGSIDIDTDNTSGISANTPSMSTTNVGMLDKFATNANIAQIVGAMGQDFERIAESGDGYDYKVRTGNVEYTHYYQFKGSYAEKTFIWSGIPKTLHRAACGPTSCVNLLTGYGLDVNPTDNIVGISFNATIAGCGEFMESYGVTGQVISGDYKSAIEEAFSEGRPIITLMNNGNNNFWTSGGHFVPCVGMDSNGNIITLDSGSSSPERHTYTGGIDGLITTMKGLWVADKAPDGSLKGEADPYVGYEGNEAVVSPVTGILLDYGTYENVDAEDTDATKEDPRVNVDLKYGFPNIYENISEENSGNTQGNEPEGFKSQIVSDKVGYAKILVLDAENYQKLESGTSNRWENDSLVRIDKTNVTLENTEQVTSSRVSFREYLDGKKANKDDDYSDVYKDWSVLDKTIYGYKEFAETYEKYGIAGYVVYIDGFKCELPDESLSGGDSSDDSETNMAEQMPSGEKLTIDSFKIGEDQLESEDIIPSKYESDEAYKLASDTSTNKLAAEVDLKTEAASSIATDNLIFIKEGTILGRTLTDKELLESPDFRDSKYGTYEELRGEEEDKTSGNSGNEDEEDNSKLIGNYLRIIMKDKDGTTVENVEDYMKLDEKKSTDNDWELFFWLPFESGGTDIDGCGPESQGTCSEGETAVGIIQWTVLLSSNMNNIGSQFIPGCLEEDSALCAPLQAYSSWSASDFWNDYKGSKQFQATLSSICDTDRDGFLHVQMEVAKKQYLQPLLDEYPWLESRPACVQGAVMHLKVWGASTSWLSSYSSSSDEDIVLKVRNTIANTGSTAGPASGDETTGRAYNEPQIALEILKGTMSEDDVEQWVRNKDVKYLSFTWRG